MRGARLPAQAVARRKREQAALKERQRQLKFEEDLKKAEHIYLEAEANVAKCEADVIAEAQVTRLVHTAGEVGSSSPHGVTQGSHHLAASGGGGGGFGGGTKPPTPAAGSAMLLHNRSYGSLSAASTTLGSSLDTLGVDGGATHVTATTILTTAARQGPELGRLQKRVEMARARADSAKQAWERLLSQRPGGRRGGAPSGRPPSQ